MDADVIGLVAQVYKVQNTVDGGMRITLDCGSDAVPMAGRLMLLANTGDLVAVALTNLEGNREPRRAPKRLGKASEMTITVADDLIPDQGGHG